MSKQAIEESLIDNKENIAKVKGRVDENPDPYIQHEITTPSLFIEDKPLTGEQSCGEVTNDLEN